jgi:hypothetical protein
MNIKEKLHEKTPDEKTLIKYVYLIKTYEKQT